MNETIVKNIYMQLLCFIFGILAGAIIGGQMASTNILKNTVLIEKATFTEFTETILGKQISPELDVDFSEKLKENTTTSPVETSVHKKEPLTQTTEPKKETVEQKPAAIVNTKPDVPIENDQTLKTAGITMVPDYCGTFKAFMSKNALTSVSSPQYKLQQDASIWIDSSGMQRYNDDYVIAVGKYFADSIGDRLLVTMENGTTFTAIVGDFKALAHTDPSNMYNPGSMSVIEFIVDMNTLNKTVMKMGDVSYLPDLDMKGKVKSMQKI